MYGPGSRALGRSRSGRPRQLGTSSSSGRDRTATSAVGCASSRPFDAERASDGAPRESGIGREAVRRVSVGTSRAAAWIAAPRPPRRRSELTVRASTTRSRPARSRVIRDLARSRAPSSSSQRCGLPVADLEHEPAARLEHAAGAPRSPPSRRRRQRDVRLLVAHLGHQRRPARPGSTYGGFETTRSYGPPGSPSRRSCSSELDREPGPRSAFSRASASASGESRSRSRAPRRARPRSRARSRRCPCRRRARAARPARRAARGSARRRSRSRAAG